MATLKQMDKRQTEFILNLKANELKKYIDNITKQYYIHLSRNEESKVASIVELLNKIIELHSKNNVENYINYSLVNSFNEVLLKSVEVDSNINLIAIKEPGLSNHNDNNIFSETQLEKVVRYFETEKAFKYCDELHEKLKTDDDIKEYFNYNDYVV